MAIPSSVVGIPLRDEIKAIFGPHKCIKAAKNRKMKLKNAHYLIFLSYEKFFQGFFISDSVQKIPLPFTKKKKCSHNVRTQ